MERPELDPLSRLSIHGGSDKYGAHLYTPIYHKLFQHLRNRPIRLLEIGIGGYDSPKAGGASLRMWAEYFPHGAIVGLDIYPKQLAISPRVTTIEGSQTDQGLLDRITAEHGPFDIIIDDGSHVVDHTIISFRHLFPKMAEGGIYAVEDVQTAFLPNSAGTGTIFEVAHRLALAMHQLEGWAPDDPCGFAAQGAATHSVAVYRNLVVFERGRNTYPSNLRFSLDDAEVRQVYAAVGEEAAGSSAPRSRLVQIDMNIWGGRPDEAARLALAAADAAPGDADLLHELIKMMEWAGQRDVTSLLRQRLDNAAGH